MKIKKKTDKLLALLKQSLVRCPSCRGKKIEEYEYWTNLYGERVCTTCKGNGKVLNSNLISFIKEFIY